MAFLIGCPFWEEMLTSISIHTEKCVEIKWQKLQFGFNVLISYNHSPFKKKKGYNHPASLSSYSLVVEGFLTNSCGFSGKYGYMCCSMVIVSCYFYYMVLICIKCDSSNKLLL